MIRAAVLRRPASPAVSAERARVLMAGLMLAALSLLSGLALAYEGAVRHDFAPPLVLAGVLLLGLALWRRPVLGVYLAFAAAILFEERELRFSDSLTDRLPLFESLSSTLELPGMVLTPVELLLVMTGVCWLLHNLDRDGVRVKPDMFAKPLLVFVAFLVLAMLHGVQSGASFELTLWMVRGFLHLTLGYFLASQLIGERRQLHALGWLFLLAVGVKGLLGWYRYAVTLGGDPANVEQVTGVDAVNSLLAHEESFFLAAFFLGLAVAALAGASARVRLASLLLAPPVAVAFLANDRRAAVVALAFAFAALLVLGLRVLPERRRLLLTLAAITAVAVPLYLAACWDSDGLLAQPAQAIRSGFKPDERDFSSNDYRRLEAANLEQTFRQNVYFGVGFGVPMTQVEELPDISKINPWYLLVPHNTVLWLLATTGFLGFVAFWRFAGAVFVRGLQQARALRSMELRGFALFAVLTMAMFLVIGYLDQGLFNMRLGLFMGVLLGALARLADIERSEEQP